MKKRHVVVLAVVVIVGLLALIYTAFIIYGVYNDHRTSAAVNRTAVSTEKTLKAIEKAKPYSIEQITPEWIMVRAKNNRWGKYSEALAKGLKELGENYTIIDVKPMQEHHYNLGSHANFSAPVQAFLVKVKPKY